MTKAIRKTTISDQLTKEIFVLTISFQLEFPVIYESLLVTPLFLNYNPKGISNTEFEALRILRAQQVLEKKWRN